MTTEQYEAEMQKFGKALLVVTLGVVGLFVTSGAVFSMLMH
jgi:hypothetical protein